MMKQICSMHTLRRALKQVARNRGSPGVDRQTVQDFGAHRDQNLAKLSRELRTGKYRPQPVRRVMIPKPGSSEKRSLGIPTVRDRVVQAAVLQVLEPIFEAGFADHSFGFRSGRRCLDALQVVDVLLKSDYSFVLDADVEKFFDSIPHDQLLDQVRIKVADEKVIGLIRSFLEAGVMEQGAPLLESEYGTPQGGVISPLLANLYMDPLDHLMERLGFKMVRYADDFMILCRHKEEAEEAREIAGDWLAKAGLTLHPIKTQIRDFKRPETFNFLGYHFDQDQRRPREESLDKLRQSVRVKTSRYRSDDLEMIIRDLNETLLGWFGYFQFSTGSFHDLDIWVMDRLRSILRKRKGGRGSQGRNRKSWPDSHFTDQGLFSLSAAHHGVTPCWV